MNFFQSTSAMEFKLLLEPIVLEPVKKNIEKLNGWRFNTLKSQVINLADNYHKLNNM